MARTILKARADLTKTKMVAKKRAIGRAAQEEAKKKAPQPKPEKAKPKEPSSVWDRLNKEDEVGAFKVAKDG